MPESVQIHPVAAPPFAVVPKETERAALGPIRLRADLFEKGIGQRQQIQPAVQQMLIGMQRSIGNRGVEQFVRSGESFQSTTSIRRKPTSDYTPEEDPSKQASVQPANPQPTFAERPSPLGPLPESPSPAPSGEGAALGPSVADTPSVSPTVSDHPEGGVAPPSSDPAPSLNQPSTPAAKQPSPANPSSGVNWEEVITGNITRTGLEVTRVIPALGLSTGLAADGITAYNDIKTLKGIDAPWTKGLIGIRGVVGAANGVVGHLGYLNELFDDVAVASGVGAPLAVPGAAIRETIGAVKLGIDSGQTFLDLLLMTDAAYQQQTSPQQNQWKAMTTNYVGNFASSIVSTGIDGLAVMSAGTAQTQVITEAARSVKIVSAAKGQIIGFLQGLFGIYFGDLFPKEATSAPGSTARIVPTTQRIATDVGPDQQTSAADMRSLFLEGAALELQGMKRGYMIGDTILDLAQGAVKQDMDRLQNVVRVLSGGKDPFLFARDHATGSLKDMRERVSSLGKMAQSSTNAKQKAATVEGVADKMMKSVDAIQLPQLAAPTANTGLGALDKAYNATAGVATGGAQLLLNKARPALDSTKKAVNAPARSLKEHAVEIGGIMDMVNKQAVEQVKHAEIQIDLLAKQLSKCSNFEQVMNTLIEQVMRTVGLSGKFEIDDVRKAWKSLGLMIDNKIKFVDAERAKKTTAPMQRSFDDGFGPTPDSPPLPVAPPQ
jgi:hypothetical protein